MKKLCSQKTYPASKLLRGPLILIIVLALLLSAAPAAAAYIDDLADQTNLFIDDDDITDIFLTDLLTDEYFETENFLAPLNNNTVEVIIRAMNERNGALISGATLEVVNANNQIQTFSIPSAGIRLHVPRNLRLNVRAPGFGAVSRHINGVAPGSTVTVWTAQQTPNAFFHPLNDPRASISSHFGWRNLGGIGFHNGIDFRVPVGRHVFSATAGRVDASTWHADAGNFIRIRDSNSGMFTRYLHLDRRDVNAGATVSRGQRIGISGNTGRSTGPHLHFDVSTGTSPGISNSFDPLLFIPR